MNTKLACWLFWTTCLSLTSGVAFLGRLFASGWRWNDWSFWISTVSFAASLVLTAWRWDWKCRLPTSVLRWLTLLAAAGLAALGVVISVPWLAGLSVFLLLTGFWQSHQDRFTGGSLVPTWPALFGFVGYPAVVGLAVWQAYTPFFAKCLASALRFFAVPHVAYPSTIVFADYRLFMDEATATVFSGMLFMAAAGLYSALLRRSIVQAIANFGLALFTCGLFQLGFHLMRAMLHHRFQADFPEPGPWYAALITWLLISVLIFLSLERLLSGLLYPVRDAFLPDQANPFVFVWNKLNGQARANSTRRRADDEESRMPGWQQAVYSSVTIVVLFGAVALFANMSLLNSRSSQVANNSRSNSLVRDDSLDHRRLTFQLGDTRPLVQADVYSSLTPLLAQEIAIYGTAVRASQALQLAAARGWNTEGIVDLIKAADDGLRRNAAAVDGKLSTAVVYTAYLDESGTAIVAGDEIPNGSTTTIQAIAEYPQPPKPEELTELQDRLEELLKGDSQSSSQ